MFKKLIVCLLLGCMMVGCVSCKSKGVESNKPYEDEAEISDQVDVAKESDIILNLKSLGSSKESKYRIKEKNALDEIVLQSNVDIKKVILYELDDNLIDTSQIAEIKNIPKEEIVSIVADFGDLFPTKMIYVELNNEKTYKVIPLYKSFNLGFQYILADELKEEPDEKADIYVNSEIIEYSLKYFKNGTLSSIANYQLTDETKSKGVIKFVSNKNLKIVELIQLSDEGLEIGTLDSRNDLKAEYPIIIRADYTKNDKMIRFITTNGEEFSFVPYYNESKNTVEFYE